MYTRYDYEKGLNLIHYTNKQLKIMVKSLKLYQDQVQNYEEKQTIKAMMNVLEVIQLQSALNGKHENA